MTDPELCSLERICSKDDLSDSNVATLTVLGLKAASEVHKLRSQLAEARMLARDAQIQAEDRGRSYQAARAERNAAQDLARLLERDRDDLARMLADLRADLDTMIATHDEVKRDRDANLEIVEALKRELAEAHEALTASRAELVVLTTTARPKPGERCPRCHYHAPNIYGCARCNPDRLGERLFNALEANVRLRDELDALRKEARRG